MTGPAAEPYRKWALQRFGPGDWACMANDSSALWRFVKYEDGSDYGLEVSYQARTFWAAMFLPAEHLGKVLPEDPWSPPWQLVAQWLPTRAAAITTMLKHRG